MHNNCFIINNIDKFTISNSAISFYIAIIENTTI